jgi:hypothetical protein
MKNLYLRSCVALACAIGLSGCGGSDDGDILLRVNIVGVNKDGLALTLNGGAELPVVANSIVFDFPNLVGVDYDYEIKIAKVPSNVTCELFNGKGKTATFSPPNIAVVCTPKYYNITGTVSGLVAAGLVVANGNDRIEIPANATTFTMTRNGTDGKPLAGANSGQVGDGYTYSLAVLTQPATGTCSIANPVGRMGPADVTNVAITCN